MTARNRTLGTVVHIEVIDSFLEAGDPPNLIIDLNSSPMSGQPVPWAPDTFGPIRAVAIGS